MRAFIFAVASLALIICVSSSPVETRDGLPVVYGFKYGDKCPAKYFYDDCNHCICNKSGVSAACTYILCPSQVRSRRSVSDLPHIDNFHEVQQCTPGKSFYDNCNSCHCNEDGKSAVCTLALCPPNTKPRIDDYIPGNKCPAGKTFYNWCNRCHCSENGLSAFCTSIACPEEY